MLLDARASHLNTFVLKTGDTMTGALTINCNSASALLVEQDGVNDDVLLIDTATPLVTVAALSVSGDVTVGDDLIFSASGGQLYKQIASGAASMDFNMEPQDGTSEAKFRFFRETNTTGQVSIQLLKGDNSTTVIHQILCNGTTAFNEQGDDIDFKIEGDNFVNLVYVDASADAVGINTNSPGAQLHIDQSSTTGAKPVATFDQADVSEEFLRFIGTAAAATLTQSIVAEGDVNTATRAVWLKVYIQDDGNQVTDQAYFVPGYTLA